MPRNVVEYRCLIISPADVAREREEVVDVIHRWNASVGAGRAIRIEPLRWETHAHPDLSGPPQEVVNSQIVDGADFGIAIFWCRLGTPTASHGSGSVEEIDRLIARGAKVMVYRSTAPIAPDQIDDAQRSRLKVQLDRYFKAGLLGQFANISELREQVNRDLTLLVGRQHDATHEPSPEVETARRPDIRVSANAVMTVDAEGGALTAVQVRVANHSPQALHLSGVHLRLDDGQGLWFKRDGLARTPNGPARIDAGDAYDFHITRSMLAGVETSRIVCAEAHDRIGRVFSSDPEQTRRCVEAILTE